MSKHTPGPWEASHDIGANCVATITSGWVVVPIGADPNKFDAKADAQLIAAAPEMLEALRAMLASGLPNDKDANGIDATQKAIAAINKARGKTDCRSF